MTAQLYNIARPVLAFRVSGGKESHAGCNSVLDVRRYGEKLKKPGRPADDRRMMLLTQ